MNTRGDQTIKEELENLRHPFTAPTYSNGLDMAVNGLASISLI